MMEYEIVNPSDPYTLKSDDFEAAALACVILGNGKYALKPLEDGGVEVPLFVFGGHDEWFQKTFGVTLDGSLSRVERSRIAAVLETVTIGNSKKRSSMNDIGGRAKALAIVMREVKS